MEHSDIKRQATNQSFRFQSGLPVTDRKRFESPLAVYAFKHADSGNKAKHEIWEHFICAENFDQCQSNKFNCDILFNASEEYQLVYMNLL